MIQGINFLINLVIHFLIGKVVNDGQFIEILMLSNLFLYGFVNIGIDYSRISTVIHLRLQFIVLTRQNVETVRELLNLRSKSYFLLFKSDHLLVISFILINFGHFYFSC